MFKKSKEISLDLEKISENQKKVKIELEIYYQIFQIYLILMSLMVKMKMTILKFLNQVKFLILILNLNLIMNWVKILKMLDFDLATKTTGSRFVFVKDKLALLERALSNFMLDTHVNQNQYQEISPPLIASDNTMFGTGQLPKFENDQFEIKFDRGFR